MSTAQSNFVDELVRDFHKIDTVYITPRERYIKFLQGHSAQLSWSGDWEDVMQSINFLFGKEVFNEQRRWLEAGCLFTAICLFRAHLELQYGNRYSVKWPSGQEFVGEGIVPLRPVCYLGLARLCFNSGLAYPTGVRIPEVEWLPCFTDLPLCISHAKRIEEEAVELYGMKRWKIRTVLLDLLRRSNVVDPRRTG